MCFVFFVLFCFVLFWFGLVCLFVCLYDSVQFGSFACMYVL